MNLAQEIAAERERAIKLFNRTRTELADMKRLNALAVQSAEEADRFLNSIHELDDGSQPIVSIRKEANGVFDAACRAVMNTRRMITELKSIEESSLYTLATLERASRAASSHPSQS